MNTITLRDLRPLNVDDFSDVLFAAALLGDCNSISCWNEEDGRSQTLRVDSIPQPLLLSVLDAAACGKRSVMRFNQDKSCVFAIFEADDKSKITFGFFVEDFSERVQELCRSAFAWAELVGSTG